MKIKLSETQELNEAYLTVMTDDDKELICLPICRKQFVQELNEFSNNSKFDIKFSTSILQETMTDKIVLSYVISEK